MQTDITSGASHQRPTRARDLGDRTSARPAGPRRIVSHADFVLVLRRVGYPMTQAQSVLRGLPDPIDVDHDGQALLQRGVSLDRLIDARGGSP